MDPELKTAAAMGVAIAAVVVAAGAWLQQLDGPPPGEGWDGGGIDGPGPRAAPRLSGVSGYINTSAEDLASRMEGRVVLYDIWTYSCVNCVRTLPHISAWDAKYADRGLLVVGVHTPEFEFEKEIGNVERAVEKHGIGYPVVLDNDREIWDSFGNRYWPRKYVADHEGYIRYDHIGEGAYAETERVIQALLSERAAALGEGAAAPGGLVGLEEFQHTRMRTPELYLGYQLAAGRSHLGNAEGFRPGQVVQYSAPDSPRPHAFYMDGRWENLADHMRMDSAEGRIVLHYSARQVNIVAAGEADVAVAIDGDPVPGGMAGSDLDGGGALRVRGPGLYNVVEGESAGRHVMELRASGDLEVYTFTFG